MKQFSDNQGRVWDIDINISSVRQLKKLLDVNLMEAVGGTLLERISEDPAELCDIIYVLCKEQADAAGVTDESFGKAMAGDAIDKATQAFIEELVNFFPNPKRRLLAKAAQKMTTLQEKIVTAAETRLDDPRLEQKLIDTINSSGNLPE